MSDESRLKCFVVSPIGAAGSEERRQADKVLKHLIRKSLGKDYQVQRGDEDPSPGAITPRIVAAIQEADLIVADISGANANVFYEVAIAHGFGRPTVHIQNAGEKPPFDVKDMRIITYDLADPDELEKAQSSLKTSAASAREHPDRLETPLTSAGKFIAVSESTDPVAESNVQTVEAISSLAKDVREVLQHVSRISSVGSSDNASPYRNLEGNSSDYSALRKVITAALRGGRLTVSDFAETISGVTSPAHDEFVRDIAERLTSDDPFGDDVNDILYDPSIMSRRPRNDDDMPF